MKFFEDIFLPFIIGFIGIYMAYMIFDLFLKLSFGIVSTIKDKIKTKNSKLGKWSVLTLSFVVVIVVVIIIIGNVLGETILQKKNIFRILFGLIGFVLFVLFVDSPLHEKYKKQKYDE